MAVWAIQCGWLKGWPKATLRASSLPGNQPTRKQSLCTCQDMSSDPLYNSVILPVIFHGWALVDSTFLAALYINFWFNHYCIPKQQECAHNKYIYYRTYCALTSTQFCGSNLLRWICSFNLPYSFYFEDSVKQNEKSSIHTSFLISCKFYNII